MRPSPINPARLLGVGFIFEKPHDKLRKYARSCPSEALPAREIHRSKALPTKSGYSDNPGQCSMSSMKGLRRAPVFMFA